MKIALIGSGKIGSNLARLASTAGYEVVISNSRGPETLSELAAETGAIAAHSEGAPLGADIVIVTTPLIAVPLFSSSLLEAISDDAAVIDTNNYYPQRDGKIDDIENGETESRWVQRLLQRYVVKAFNNINFKHLLTKSRPVGDAERLALPIAGDDAKSKQRVADFISTIGFDTVDAGGLDQSWRQQPGTPVYGAEGNTKTIKALLGEAKKARQENWRA